MARSLTTTDHETIRSWADQRGGKPAEVTSTAKGIEVGTIRIDFSGSGGEGTLREISWDEWFTRFDGASLALVYEEETADGQRSSSHELARRETAGKQAEGVKANRRARRAGTRKVSRTAAGRPRGSRQAARAEAARTARSKRSTGGAPAAARGSARGRKGAASRRSGAGRRASSSRRTGASTRKSARGRSVRKG